MTADIEKAAQEIISPADYDNRFAGDISGDEIAGFGELIEPGCQLPGSRKDRGQLQLIEFFVGIPGSRDGPGTFQWSRRVIAVDDAL